jgi:HK97 family phage major capsid protein
MDDKMLRDLRARRKVALDAADAITTTAETESRGVTEDENKTIQAHLKEGARLSAELEGFERARVAREAIDAAKVADVPETQRKIDPADSPRVQVLENEHRAYRKGDALGAILAARLKYEPHEQARAVREAESLYGSGSPQVRAMTQSSFTGGGALIPENFVGSEFIELLRAQSAVRGAGCRMVTLTNGSFITPRLASGAQGAWVGQEGDNLATSEATFEQLNLVEKKYGVVVPFSNDLRRNASLDAVRIVQEDLVRATANDEDLVFLKGTGLAGQPKGIYNWIPAGNKANSAGTSLANVRTDIRKMKNGLDGANVPYINRGFLMHSRTMNYMGWDLVDGNSNFAFPSLQNAGGATLGGDRVYRDNNISITLSTDKSEIYYAEFNECYIADSLDMEFEFITNAVYSQGGTIRSGVSRDESVLRLIRKTDFGMRHTASAFIIELVAYGS